MQILVLLSVISVISAIIAALVIVRLSKAKIQSQNAELEFNLTFFKQQHSFLEEKIRELTILNEKEREKYFQAIKEKELAELKFVELQTRMHDWEQSKNQAIEHAKAAIFEVGSKLSSKLVEDHRRETEQVKKESVNEFKENTAKYQEQFTNIVQQVAALNSQVKESKELVDIVQRALLSPTGAGSLAEITLENILKASGLIANQDYFLQFSFTDDGDRYRPDAVIFLPNDNVMVIDSKASKFFLEMAKAESEQEAQELASKLKYSMRQHLKALATKDYKESLKNYIRSLSSSSIKHVTTLMFLPSETALEKLHYLDNEFVTKAWEQHIYPAGPVGIVNILAHAKFQVSENKQSQNYQIIKDEVSALLANISTLFEHARKLGNSLFSATQNYDKFALSFNSHMLTRTKKLIKLGVAAKNHKETPTYLERYQLVNTQSPTVIEVEADEDEVKKLEEIE